MTAVVHLVWGPLGAARLREFVTSYREHPAGLDHELVVLFNGVRSEQRSELLAELEGVEHRLLTLEDAVQDLIAYVQAAARLEHERLCFLNSYSVILAPNWLAKLGHALDQAGVGLVGASGSWASMRSWALNLLFLPTPYRGVAPERKVVFEQFHALTLELDREGGGPSPDGGQPRRSLAGSMLGASRALWSTAEQLLRFEGFPAVHVRTNAFMVERAVFAGLRTGRLARKMDAYSVESGRKSYTSQIRSMGLRGLVVDRDGGEHEWQEWPRSRTFWQGDQEGLLIADNQTRIYANGGFDRRRMLSALAWGPQADPGMPVAASDSLGPEPGS